jgi:rubrerythrin
MSAARGTSMAVSRSPWRGLPPRLWTCPLCAATFLVREEHCPSCGATDAA